MAELLGAGAEDGEPVGEDGLVEGVVLERGQVAVDGLVGPGQFGLDGSQFGVPAAVGGLVR